MTTIAIIGGTGLYAIEGLENQREHRIATPFGEPSDTVLEASLGGARILFLARHGRHHSLLPTEVNARANIWALKSLGAEWCVSVSAVGSLKEELAPGDLCVPDQLLDRTRNRPNTFFGDGLVGHVSFGNPYCAVLRKALIDSCRELKDTTIHTSGTYVCMEGPAFSTRAESELYRSWGASVIGMTALPEAKLAREAEIAYATLALVTDYDCWRVGEAHVDASAVVATLKQNSAKAKAVVKSVVPKLKRLTPSPECSEALKHAFLTAWEHVPSATVTKLEPIVRRYLERA